MRGQLYGRRIRVTIGNIIVADIDPAVPDDSAGRSLDVSFTTEAHTKLEPLTTTVEVIGLNRDTRTRLEQQQKAAKKVAWDEYQKVLTGALEVIDEEQVLQVKQQIVYRGLQVRVEAGYQDDFALIADATTLQDGVKHDTSAVPRSTFAAQDGRYPWQNGFVSEEVAPGVTFYDWNLITSLSEGFLTGTVTSDQVDEATGGTLLTRKNFNGYFNSRVLEGDASARVEEMANALGLTPFFDRGQRIYLNVDAVTADEAVVLRLLGKPNGDELAPAPGGLLSYVEQDRGFLTVNCLLNHRITPGRQVFVYDEDGKPVGAGVFRCDYVKHSGSTFDATFNSEAILRPVTIPAATNV